MHLAVSYRRYANVCRDLAQSGCQASPGKLFCTWSTSTWRAFLRSFPPLWLGRFHHSSVVFVTRSQRREGGWLACSCASTTNNRKFDSQGPSNAEDKLQYAWPANMDSAVHKHLATTPRGSSENNATGSEAGVGAAFSFFSVLLVGSCCKRVRRCFEMQSRLPIEYWHDAPGLL